MIPKWYALACADVRGMRRRLDESAKVDAHAAIPFPTPGVRERETSPPMPEAKTSTTKILKPSVRQYRSAHRLHPGCCVFPCCLARHGSDSRVLSSRLWFQLGWPLVNLLSCSLILGIRDLADGTEYSSKARRAPDRRARDHPRRTTSVATCAARNKAHHATSSCTKYHCCIPIGCLCMTLRQHSSYTGIIVPGPFGAMPVWLPGCLLFGFRAGYLAASGGCLGRLPCLPHCTRSMLTGSRKGGGPGTWRRSRWAAACGSSLSARATTNDCTMTKRCRRVSPAK